MKKAYVKPVFFAEEYEMTASVANCEFNADIEKAQIWEGMQMCDGKTDGHVIGGQQNDAGFVNEKNLWQYATGESTADDGRISETSYYNDSAYLFAGKNSECDFIWNQKDGPVGIWTTQEFNNVNQINSSNWITDVDQRKNSGFISWIGSFAEVFFGNKAGFGQHTPAYQGEVIFS